MKKRTVLLYAGMAGAIALSIFLWFKANGLQHQLEVSDQSRLEMEGELNSYRQLERIDSMLLKGNYNTALRSYGERMETSLENRMSIPLRIALAKKLSKFEAAYVAQTKREEEEAADSIQKSQAATSQEVQRYDAVSFELEKANVQLARMRKQLQEKSFGEYLTFKSKKGSQMHYVGKVKNNKANGLGFALLDTGSRYQGEWKDNQRHGEGTFHWPDGEYYIGSYVDDQRNGKGSYFWPNGEKYVGNWKDDKRNGQGVFYGTDGELITKGLWKDDKLVEETD